MDYLIIQNPALANKKYEFDYLSKEGCTSLPLIAIAVQFKQEATMFYLLEREPKNKEFLCQSFGQHRFVNGDWRRNEVIWRYDYTVLYWALRNVFRIDTIILILQSGAKEYLTGVNKGGINRDLQHVFPTYLHYQIVQGISENEICANLQKLYDYLKKAEFIWDETVVFEGKNALTIAMNANKPKVVRLLLQMEIYLDGTRLNLWTRYSIPVNHDFHCCNLLFLMASACATQQNQDFKPYNKDDLERIDRYGNFTYQIIKCFIKLFNPGLLQKKTLWQQYSDAWQATPGDFRKKAIACLQERGEYKLFSTGANHLFPKILTALNSLSEDNPESLQAFIDSFISLEGLGDVNPEGDLFTRTFFLCCRSLIVLCNPVQKIECQALVLRQQLQL